jgi:hypothetical protein
MHYALLSALREPRQHLPRVVLEDVLLVLLRQPLDVLDQRPDVVKHSARLRVFVAARARVLRAE